MDSLILVSNPGSASKKYALYDNGNLRASLHFEFEGYKIVASINFEGKTRKAKIDSGSLSLSSKYLVGILLNEGVLKPDEKISAIGIRIVAPGTFFTGDHLVNGTFLMELVKVEKDAPLHIKTALEEIRDLNRYFKGVKIIAISDSEFHSQRPVKTLSYGIDLKIARRADVFRFGYHGISLASVTEKLKNDKKYSKLGKIVVAHLGSGCSVTALTNYKSFDTSMGYTPLEGLMSATRSGSIDLPAALKIKKSEGLKADELEDFLNKKSGLLGVSGVFSDIRELQKIEKKKLSAGLALDMFVYRAACEIGSKITAISGIDALIFTGTVGERSFMIRKRVIEKLKFLGFNIIEKKNLATVNPSKIIEIQTRKSPLILVVPLDENLEIAERTKEFIN